MDRIEAMLQAAQTLDEFRQMLHEGFDDAEARELGGVIELGLLASDLAGRAAIEDEADDA